MKGMMKLLNLNSRLITMTIMSVNTIKLKIVKNARIFLFSSLGFIFFFLAVVPTFV